MSPTMLAFRSTVALLLVLLGLAIVGRGLIQGAPLTFTGMGLLMAGLGVYRLRLLRVGRWGER